MADAAIVLYDEVGNLIVDSKNVNMFLRHMGVGTSITFAAAEPVVFFRPLGEFGTLRHLLMNGNGTYTAVFVGGPCEYYVFDRPWVTGGPIDIWSEDGRHIFMSTARPMNVYTTFTIPRYWNSDGTGVGYRDGYTYTGLPSGKWAYSAAYNRRGYQCYAQAGGGWSSFLWGEHYSARVNGIYSRIQDNLGTYLGWAPLRNNVFYSKAEGNDIAVIDVTGWQ